MGPQEISIPIPGCELKGLAWGSSDAPTRILALHGWLDNCHSFLPIAKYLSEDIYFVAPDLPGHGHSDHKPPGTPYHFVDGITDVLNIFITLGWDSCHLLGHSMGAGIATLAAAAPENFASLILLEGLGPLSAEPSEVVTRYRTYFRQLKRLAAKRYPLYDDRKTAVAARLAAGDISQSACELLADRGLKSVGDQFTWRSDNRLKINSALRFTEAQVVSFLKAIECRTMLVEAESGYKFAEDQYEARKESIRNLVFHRIPGNHHVHMDEPRQILDLISEFLPGQKT